MSHYRHPRFIEPAAYPIRPTVAVAVNLGRDTFIQHLRHHSQPRASDNPFAIGTNEHDLWFAALLTEATDLLDVMAADRAAGSFTIHQ